jgi:hypothetical protein
VRIFREIFEMFESGRVIFVMSLRNRSALPRRGRALRNLGESHEVLLGLSDSEDAVLSTMAVQILDVLAITENGSVNLWLSDG